MAGFNKVLLLGNLTRDPQLSYTPNQTAVVDFGLATNRRWTGQDGAQREETCFVDCRAFGRNAENINKYLSKGRMVFVEGRLTFDSWTAADGTRRSRHRVTVESFQFLPGTPGAGVSAPDKSTLRSKATAEDGTIQPPPATSGGQAEEGPQVEQPSGHGVPAEPGETSADDIPF